MINNNKIFIKDCIYIYSFFSSLFKIYKSKSDMIKTNIAYINHIIKNTIFKYKYL